IYLRDGRFYEAGDLFVQPDLAATLKRIQEQGYREFYEGKTAQLILHDMEENGGFLTARDLKENSASVREPLRVYYRGFDIITSPPPSSGGITILEILNLLELYNIRDLGFHSAAEIHLLVESMKRAYADRLQYVGDPDFVPVPVNRFVSKEYAKT